MKKIFIVTAENGFFAQNVMPWSSMDVNFIKMVMVDKGFDVSIVTFAYLKANVNRIFDAVIIYTSSQRVEHKKYIEDLMFFFNDKNILVPSLEALYAHDNKGFQRLLDAKYNLGLIDSEYYADISEIEINKQQFPCVYKPANGASSIGVEIVSSVNEICKVSNSNWNLNMHVIKTNLKKYIFKTKYNYKWEEYLGFGKNRFVLQKFLPGMSCDFKVLIFGEKYYILKRFVKKNDFKASGSGLHSRSIPPAELNILLNKAKEIKSKFKAHLYSLDLCIYQEQVHLIEFQFTHIGPLTLTDSESYFIFNDGHWCEIFDKSNLEFEFCNAVEAYL